MKNFVLSILAISALAGCSGKPLEKANLEYKVFPKASSYQYDFNLAIPLPTDARHTNFVLDNDEYFAKDIKSSLANILFEEIRASNSFNTLAVLDRPLSFDPSSTEIQEVRRSVGKDAILLTQINKFNVNVRKLSDLDASNFVNLTVFTNISYKLVLTDSETVIFLTTKDTTSSKVIPLNENVYKTINELAQKNIKNNVTDAKNDFLIATKAVVDGDYKNESFKAKPVEAVKQFSRAEAAQEAEKLAATEQAENTEQQATAPVQEAENAEKIEQEQTLAQAEETNPATEETKVEAEQAVQETKVEATEDTLEVETTENQANNIESEVELKQDLTEQTTTQEVEQTQAN